MTANLPGALDTIISLCAVYLVLSVLCSHANEQIAAVLRLRGKKLYMGVLNLVVGERSIAEAVYAHPLITSSSEDPAGKPAPPPPTTPAANAAKTPGTIAASMKRLLPSGRTDYRPSFIDSRNFSLAFWDAIQRSQTTGDAITVDHTAASVIGAPDALFENIKSKVGALPQGHLQRHLAALLNDAQGDYDRLLRATDAWFDRQMDRVSGWYKRNTQYIMLAISAVVVFGAGIDSIRIITRLYSDPATRNAIVSRTADVVATSSARDTANRALAPGTQPPAPAAGATPVPAEVAAGKLNEIFSTLPLDTYLTGFGGVWVGMDDPKWVRIDALHLAGLLMSVFAGALGGPFWFSALSSIVNVRMSGPKPVDKSTPKNNPPAPPP